MTFNENSKININIFLFVFKFVRSKLVQINHITIAKALFQIHKITIFVMVLKCIITSYHITSVTE